MTTFAISDQHIENRLKTDLMCWLNTVRPDGRPHSAAVWFLWQDNKIFIFSKPDTVKVRNLQQNPNVTVSIDDTRKGGDVITLEGTAELFEGGLGMLEPGYLAKYGPLIKEYGWVAEELAKEYSQTIVITPKKLVRVL